MSWVRLFREVVPTILALISICCQVVRLSFADLWAAVVGEKPTADNLWDQ